jgi:uncharacterized membrane protein YphA (DoxX/SURF4 family)
MKIFLQRLRKGIRDHWITVGLFLLSIIFLVAGINKILDPDYFLQSMEQLKGIPGWAIPFIRVCLPLAEISIGAMLVLGIRPAMFASLALNIFFLLFIFGNYVANVGSVDCGCFGKVLSSEIGVTAILRQMVIVSLNIGVVLSLKRRQE